MNPIALVLLTVSVILLSIASAEKSPAPQPATESPQKPVSSTSAKPAAPAGDTIGGRKPIIFIDIAVKKQEQRDPVIAAWEAGLGRPTDIVCAGFGPDNRDEVAKLKAGEHGWMDANVRRLGNWMRDTGQADQNLRWIWYNIEGGTPQAERVRAYKTAENFHAICAQHGWKFGIITDEALPRLIAYAQRCDALIFECQKDQNGRTANKMGGLAAKLREVNPKCLFGIQLGVGVPQKGYGGTNGAVAFYKLTQSFTDLYSIWWGSPETMIEVLQKLNALPASKLPAKASLENEGSAKSQ